MPKSAKRVDNKGEILDSWKEIASYIKKDLRTCQRWERRLQLPVHRFADSPRSRVFAYKNEIDKWLLSREGVQDSGLEMQEKDKTWKVKLPSWISVSIVGILIIAGLKWQIFFSPPNPYDFRIEASTLNIFDDEQNEIWEFDTNINNLETNGHYQSNIKNHTIEELIAPFIIIKDINNDRNSEVLFSVQTYDHFKDNQLFCFSNTGKRIWNITIGKDNSSASSREDSDFVIKEIGAEDFDRDGNYEIVIAANHRTKIGGLLQVRNHEGELLKEDWNIGKILDLEIVDFDKDGWSDIVLAGENKEGSHGCAVLLKFSWLAESLSKQSMRLNMIQSQTAYSKETILFPPNEVEALEGHDHAISHIEIIGAQPHQMLKFSNATSDYYLNLRLELVDIIFSVRFFAAYSHFHNRGLLTLGIEQLKEKMMNQGLQYFEGEIRSHSDSDDIK